MLHIQVKFGDIIEINPLTLSIEEGEEDCHKYHKSTDEKWKKFCKEHNFNLQSGRNSKIYNLYLQLCAEGII